MVESDPLLQELEDDLRHERLKNLWRQFGRSIVSISVAVVIVAVGIVVWQNRQRDRNLENTNRFIEASDLLQAEKYQDAATAFAALRQEAGGGFAALAGLREAQALVALGKAEQANAVLNDVIARHDIEPGLKDMAALFAYALAVNANGDSPASADMPGDHPTFAATAHEMKAMALLKSHQKDKAVAELMQVKNDPHAPVSLRNRATLLLSYIDPSAGR